MRIVCVLLSFLLLWGSGAKGQETGYGRSSVSLILLGYDDSLQLPVYKSFSVLQLGDRYDKNIITTKVLPYNGPRIYIERDSVGGQSYIKTPDRSAMLTNNLNRQNVGLEVIAYIYNRQADGKLNADLINQRAAYNKTDAEYNVIQATAKKASGLQEGGEQMLRNSYVMIYDYANLRYEYKEENGSGDYYWMGAPTVYLFQVAWTDELRERFYAECWMDEDTSEDQCALIRERFNQFRVPVELVMQQSETVCEAVGITEFRKKSKAEKGNLTEDDLRAKVLSKVVENSFSNLSEGIEGRHEAFKVKSAVMDVKPVRAKIGLKEGVKTNLRFYMYEYRQDADGHLSKRRKGIIRATRKITDNRKVTTGDMEPTEFYQIAGKAAQAGWEMHERKSSGINLELGYQMGDMSGPYAGITGSLYGRKNLNHFLMLDVVWGIDKYEVDWRKFATENETRNMEYNLAKVDFNYGYGLMKRNLELYPYVGIGWNTLLSSEKEDEESPPYRVANRSDNTAKAEDKNSDKEESKFIDEGAWLFNAGVRMVVNVWYPVQLFGSAGYSLNVIEGDTYKAVKAANADFDKASSGLNYRFGLRFCF